MALLFIFFIFIAVVNLICITLLFLVKDPKINNIFFVGTVILGVLICYLNITSLASNLIVPQIVAGFFGVLSLIGIVLKYMRKFLAAKIFITASVVLGIVQLFFFA